VSEPKASGPKAQSGFPNPSHLALVGLMGAGKTSVGRTAAKRLGRPLVDTDDLVVATTGRSIPELFAEEGEASFRAHERRAVRDACESPEPAVIACGGGAVLDPENRAVLRARCCVVWLRAPVATLAHRCGTGHGRPLLAGPVPPEVALGRLADLRAPAYEAVAHVVLDTDGCSVDEAAVGVLDAFCRWGAEA
jgi:shikimate kinase